MKKKVFNLKMETETIAKTGRVRKARRVGKLLVTNT
jgi:hypothetical protein